MLKYKITRIGPHLSSNVVVKVEVVVLGFEVSEEHRYCPTVCFSVSGEDGGSGDSNKAMQGV
jgi:hypothetical protein